MLEDLRVCIDSLLLKVGTDQTFVFDNLVGAAIFLGSVLVGVGAGSTYLTHIRIGTHAAGPILLVVRYCSQSHTVLGTSH